MYQTIRQNGSNIFSLKQEQKEAWYPFINEFVCKED